MDVEKTMNQKEMIRTAYLQELNKEHNKDPVLANYLRLANNRLVMHQTHTFLKRWDGYLDEPTYYSEVASMDQRGKVNAVRARIRKKYPEIEGMI